MKNRFEERGYGRAVFFNEVQARFHLRKPKANKPTNIYLVCRINGKQVKLSTGVKVYPEHWNEENKKHTLVVGYLNLIIVITL